MKFKIISISLIVVLITTIGLILGFNWDAITTNLTKDDLYTESQVKNIKKEIEEKYKVDIENYLIKINTYEQKLNENEQTINDLKKQAVVDSNRISELEQENSTLRNQLETSKSSYQSLEERYTALQSQLSTLQEKLSNKNEEYNTLKNQYDELNKSFNSLQSSFEDLQNRYNNLSSIIDAYETGYFDGVNILRDSDFSEEEKSTLIKAFKNGMYGGKNIELLCAYKHGDNVEVIFSAIDGNRDNYYNYFSIDITSLGENYKFTKEFLLTFDKSSLPLENKGFRPLLFNEQLDVEFKEQYGKFNLGDTLFGNRNFVFDDISYEANYKNYSNLSDEHPNAYEYYFDFLVFDRGLPFIFHFTKQSDSYLDKNEELKNQLIGLYVE